MQPRLPEARLSTSLCWPAASVVAVLLAGACSPPVSPAGAGGAGPRLYAQHCAACHGDAATGRGAVAGAPSHGPGGHTWHHADTQIADIILGRAEYPGRTMPSFAGRLSEAEVEALLAHLKGGWTGEQRTAQAEVTRQWEAQQRR